MGACAESTPPLGPLALPTLQLPLWTTSRSPAFAVLGDAAAPRPCRLMALLSEQTAILHSNSGSPHATEKIQKAAMLSRGSMVSGRPVAGLAAALATSRAGGAGCESDASERGPRVSPRNVPPAARCGQVSCRHGRDASPCSLSLTCSDAGDRRSVPTSRPCADLSLPHSRLPRP